MGRPSLHGVRKKPIGVTLTPSAIDKLAVLKDKERLSSISEVVEWLIQKEPN